MHPRAARYACFAATMLLAASNTPGSGQSRQFIAEPAPVVYQDCHYFDDVTRANCALSAALALDKEGRHEDARRFLGLYMASFERAASEVSADARRRLFADFDISELSPELRSYVAGWAREKESEILPAQSAYNGRNLAP